MPEKELRWEFEYIRAHGHPYATIAWLVEASPKPLRHRPLAPLAQGDAVCHPDDKFVKETGKRVAIARALQKFDKKFRTAAWAAYFKQRAEEQAGGTGVVAKQEEYL